MFSSPTFNTLRDSAKEADNYNSGPTFTTHAGKWPQSTTSPQKEFCMVEEHDELSLVIGDSVDSFSALTKQDK